jgi:8-oxo-dGTP pyrophosphatase MutT (NUDIX family)
MADFASDDLADYLEHHPSSCEERVDWPNDLSFNVRLLLSREMPPLEFVTSVRALVLQGERVMVIRDERVTHISPGGRRQPGETLEETLIREILEETGWKVTSPTILGAIHYRHLQPKPSDYPYPYPDFFQAIYQTEAIDFDPNADRFGDIALETNFMHPDEAVTLGLSAREKFLLRMVCK